MHLPLEKWGDRGGEPADSRGGAVFVIIGPGWRFLEFPPALKRSWDISGTAVIRGASHRMTVVSRVISYESVRTRAGTFMAFRLTIDWHGIHPDYTFKSTHVVWYAPAVKFAVKEEAYYNTWELVSYSLK